MKCLTREKTEAGVEREREIRNTEILFSKPHLMGYKHNKPLNAMHTQYSIYWRWNVANEQSRSETLCRGEYYNAFLDYLFVSFIYISHIIFKFFTIARFSSAK